MNKKSIKSFLIAMVVLVMAAGCKSESDTADSDGAKKVYYLNAEQNQIVALDYEPEEKNSAKQIEEYLERLKKDPEKGGYKAAIPKEVNVVASVIDGNQLLLYFDSNYATMSVSREVLARAAIVRTLVQIPTIECITFYVGDTPLRDAEGRYVGIMTEDTFVENVGPLVTNVSEQNMTLYYASKDGKSLVPIEKKIYSNSKLSSEKLIIQQLMEGNKKEGYLSAIPKDATLLGVSVLDGVCIINFDSGFKTQDYEIQEAVVIYSIVNSLCELPSVNKVQITINGETSGVYREEYSLDRIYERNLDLVKPKEEE